MEFIGFITILLSGSLVIGAITNSIKEPSVVQAVSEYSPWIADNIEALSWVAFGVLAFILLMIPLKLKKHEMETGANGMETVGIGIVGGLQGLTVVLGVLSVSYLAGIGWLAATTN